MSKSSVIVLALFRKEGAARKRRVFYKSDVVRISKHPSLAEFRLRATLFTKEGFGAGDLRIALFLNYKKVS